MNTRVLILSLAGVLAGAVVVYMIATQEPPKTVTPKTTPKPIGENTITDEAERQEYVRQYIAVENVQIGEDQKPGDDAGTVAGLQRVTGTVLNKGDRGILSVLVVLNIQDASGKVIGSYPEDALKNKRLGPGESRAFKYIIPANKDFSGKFMTSLR